MTTDPLGDFHGDLFDLAEQAKSAGDKMQYQTITWIHDRFCHIRAAVRGETSEVKLPPSPVFQKRSMPGRS